MDTREFESTSKAEDPRQAGRLSSHDPYVTTSAGTVTFFASTADMARLPIFVVFPHCHTKNDLNNSAIRTSLYYGNGDPHDRCSFHCFSSSCRCLHAFQPVQTQTFDFIPVHMFRCGRATDCGPIHLPGLVQLGGNAGWVCGSGHRHARIARPYVVPHYPGQ